MSEVNEIKAIETMYNGYRFRSRLEARFAVLMDALGISYEYELEGYRLPNGKMYLPDFYLPQFDYYVECKGYSDHWVDDVKKALNFTVCKKTNIMFVADIPFSKYSRGVYYFASAHFTPLYSYYDHMSCGSVYFETYNGSNAIIRDGRWDLDYDDFRRMPLCQVNDLTESCIEYFDMVMKAIPAKQDTTGWESVKRISEKDCDYMNSAFLKARTARFEHGETPKRGDDA